MHRSVSKHGGAMGIFLSPLWFHVKTHQPYTRRTQATPLKSQNSAACRKQCRCKAKPVTICTLHSCHLPDKSCSKPGKATTGGTLHFEPPTKGYEVTWPHLLLSHSHFHPSPPLYNLRCTALTLRTLISINYTILTGLDYICKKVTSIGNGSWSQA